MITYRAAHDLVRRSRGPANRQACYWCGGTASHWAYQHNDPDEFRSPEGYPYGQPKYYEAMCALCHSKLDAGGRYDPESRDLSSSLRSAPCPHCGAPTGKECRLPSGGFMTGGHEARQRLTRR